MRRERKSPTGQALQAVSGKAMQDLHRFSAMGMEIPRRLHPSGSRTTQTGADRRQRMVNGGFGPALKGPQPEAVVTWGLGGNPESAPHPARGQRR